MEPSAEKTPPATTPGPAERKGVLEFVKTLKAPAVVVEKNPSPSQVSPPISEGGQLHRHLAEFSWALQQNQWLKVSFIAHLALMILIWLGAFLAFNRPTYIQIGAPTLQESAKTFYATDYLKVDPDIAYDQMRYFAIATVSLLNQVDAYSPPPLALLKGMVKPELIEKAQRRLERNRAIIQKQKFVQNLVINRVLSPITNPDSGTIALFVQGYFSIAMQDTDGSPINRVAPYRGKLIMRFGPISKLNPFSFTLEDLEEVVGENEVKKWDEDNKKFFK